MRGASRSTVPDSSSTEAQEKKAVPSQELREQILDSFIQVLSATGRDDQLIQKIIPKINKVFKAQEKFIKKDLAEKRIIRKELGEGVDESFKDELKTLEKKSETLAVQGGMISKVKALIKVSLEQTKIDELKEDLESKLNLLNVKEEELADRASKQFFNNYHRGKEYYPDLLKAFPSVIRSVENAITPDNKEKMEKLIKYLNESGENIIKEELKKLENDYQGGEKNHPALLKKLPDIIEFLEVISTSDKKLIKSLDGNYKKMLAKRGKIRRPENSLQESDDVESASLSPIMDELEEQVEERSKKLLDRQGKPMKGDGDKVAKQYAPKGLSPQSRSALGSGLVITKEKSNLTDNKSVVVNKLVKMQAMQNELTEKMKKFNNRTDAKKNTSRSLLLEFGTEGSDKKIGEDEIGKDERDREERLKMLLTLHNNEEFKKDKQKYLYLLKQLPMFIDEVINDTRNSILSKNEEHNTDKKSLPDFESKMNKRIKSLKELDQDIKLELPMMDRSIRMESKKEGNNKDGSEDESERNAKQELGAESSLVSDEGHRRLMENYNNNFKAKFNDNNEHQINGQNTSQILLPKFEKEGYDKKIDEGEGHSTEHEELMARQKKKQNKLEELIKEQVELKKSLLLEKIVVDTQRAWSERELELEKPIKVFLKKIEDKLGPIKENLTDRYPPAPTPLPKPGNSPKASQTAIPSVYSPKVNSVYSPKVNSPNSPQALAISAYPIALAAHFNPNSLPEYRQQTMFSVTYHFNTSPQQYSHVSRGPDVYSQVPRGSVHFTQTPTAISTKTSTFTPIQLSPQHNSRFN